MNVFLRRCHVLKIACLAQVVNVIAPILTTTDRLLRQTIFYPFMLFSRYAAGLSLDVAVRSPRYPTARFGDMPAIDASACHDPATGKTAVFLVNRSQTDDQPVQIVWQSPAPPRIDSVVQISGTDPKAANTFAHPDRIVPRTLPGLPVTSGMATLTLPPLSFTVLASGSPAEKDRLRPSG